MGDNTSRTPIILCCGTNGRAVVFGYVDSDPQPGQPVELFDARMLLYWVSESNGLFGVAVNGPADGSRITPAVSRVVETVWQEFLAVTPKSAALFDAAD